MLGKLKKTDNKGFTIIEVMIVLAIAGLILLIVFLAVPALQRNARNTQRKNDASHLAGLIGEWESNNAGTTPQGFATPSTATKIDISTEKFSIVTPPTTVTVLTASNLNATNAPAADTVNVMSTATCSGNSAAVAPSARSVAIVYYLEGGTTHGCVTAG